MTFEIFRVASTASRPVAAPAAPRPVVATPAPLPVVATPAPRPCVATPPPLPVVATAAPRPVVASPAPRPVVATPAPRPVVATPAPRYRSPIGPPALHPPYRRVHHRPLRNPRPRAAPPLHPAPPPPPHPRRAGPLFAQLTARRPRRSASSTRCSRMTGPAAGPARTRPPRGRASRSSSRSLPRARRRSPSASRRELGRGGWAAVEWGPHPGGRGPFWNTALANKQRGLLHRRAGPYLRSHRPLGVSKKSGA